MVKKMSPRDREKMDKTRGLPHRISLRMSDREFQILQDTSKSLGLNISGALRFIVSVHPDLLEKSWYSEQYEKLFLKMFLNGDEKNDQ